MTIKERLARVEKLALNPFDPEPLIRELEGLIEEIPNMDREELEELYSFLERLKRRLEENYSICFGWIELALKEGFSRKA